MNMLTPLYAFGNGLIGRRWIPNVPLISEVRLVKPSRPYPAYRPIYTWKTYPTVFINNPLISQPLSGKQILQRLRNPNLYVTLPLDEES